MPSIVPIPSLMVTSIQFPFKDTEALNVPSPFKVSRILPWFMLHSNIGLFHRALCTSPTRSCSCSHSQVTSKSMTNGYPLPEYESMSFLCHLPRTMDASTACLSRGAISYNPRPHLPPCTTGVQQAVQQMIWHIMYPWLPWFSPGPHIYVCHWHLSRKSCTRIAHAMNGNTTYRSIEEKSPTAIQKGTFSLITRCALLGVGWAIIGLYLL